MNTPKSVASSSLPVTRTPMEKTGERCTRTRCLKLEKSAKKMRDDIRGQIEAYQKMLEFSPTLPASYLMHGLLKIVDEFKLPAAKDDDEAETNVTVMTQEEEKEKTEQLYHRSGQVELKMSDGSVSSTSKSPGPLSRRTKRQSTAALAAGPPSVSVKRALIHDDEETLVNSSSSSRSPCSSITRPLIDICPASSSSSSSSSLVFKASGAAKKLKRSSTQQRNPAQEALTKKTVVTAIFKFLSYDDLRTCRSVDLPHWSAEARRLISQRLLLEIQLSNIKPTVIMDKTFQNQKTRTVFRSVSDLSIELDNFESGPVPEIWLHVSGVDVSSVEIKKFFKKIASFTRRLTLCYGTLNKMLPSDFQRLLNKLPNLNHLILPTIPADWKAQKQLFPQQNSSSSSSFLLPQIKTLCFRASCEFYPEFVQSLFNIMPNLQNVLNFPIHCIQILTPKNKDRHRPNLSIIKSVHFSSSDRQPSAGNELERKLSQLAKISRRTQLTSAQLRFKMSSTAKSLDLWKSFCASLSKVFENNDGTIKLLKIEPFPHCKFVKYPRMEAVKQICLISVMDWKKCENAGKVVKFFADDFNIRETFPNLTKVTCEGEKCALDEFLKFFPEDAFLNRNYFSGVTSLTLKFNDLEEVEALEKAAHLFPQVTSFSMDGDVRWLESRLTHTLRLWPKLVRLKLRVHVVMTPGRHTIVADYPLDPVFTGLSEAKCKELRENPEMVDLDLSAHRQSLAISNMKDLKELILIFDGEYAKTQKVLPLMSHVTSFYGFRPLANLQVTCAIPWNNTDQEKIREMLSPIQKHVIFKANYY